MPFSKYDIFTIYDKPIPYKSLLVYPALMSDYLLFHYCAQCLMLDKNSIPDVKIISMSYFEYLLYLYYAKNDVDPIGMFDGLLRIVLRKTDEEDFTIRYKYDEAGKAIFEIAGEIFTSNDFDAIKEIIVEQNLLELPDETIQKEIRDKMEEANRLRQRINGNKMATLEDQMIAVAVYTGWDFDKICKMSIRKFVKTLQRADLLLHYKIYLGASMSGMVEFKDKSVIKHWLSEIVPDNTNGLVKAESVQGEMNKVNNAL